MDNPRVEKVAVVDEVRERLSSADAALLTEYRGLKVSDLESLRRSLRTVGGEYKVFKNTLVRFAVRDLGIDGLEPLLTGPTAITFVTGDAVEVARALRDYARTNPNLIVKGGVLGNRALDADQARALADVPPREVLLARLAGGLAAPMVQFAGLLQALPRNFAYGLQALIDQRGGVPEAAPDAPEAAAEEDGPMTDAPRTDAPSTEPPSTEPPSTDAPSTEPPSTDAPHPELEVESHTTSDEPTIDHLPASPIDDQGTDLPTVDAEPTVHPDAVPSATPTTGTDSESEA